MLGILTPEDLVQAIREYGAEAPVRNAMQRNVQTVDAHDMLEGVVGGQREGSPVPCQLCMAAAFSAC